MDDGPTLEVVDQWIGEMLKQHESCNVPADVIREVFGEDKPPPDRSHQNLNAFALNMFGQKPPPVDLTYRQKLEALCAKHNMTYAFDGETYIFIRLDDEKES